jgi:hypothetical protein
MMIFLQDHHLVALLRQPGSHRGTGRPAADHQDIALIGHVALSLLFGNQFNSPYNRGSLPTPG